MAEMTTIFYDQDSDVLYLTVGKAQDAVSREMGNDILLRVHPKTGKIVGLTVLNFASRFSNLKQEQNLPVKMDLQV